MTEKTRTDELEWIASFYGRTDPRAAAAIEAAAHELDALRALLREAEAMVRQVYPYNTDLADRIAAALSATPAEPEGRPVAAAYDVEVKLAVALDFIATVADMTLSATINAEPARRSIRDEARELHAKLAASATPAEDGETGICPEHGALCRGGGCCCADLHRAPVPAAAPAEGPGEREALRLAGERLTAATAAYDDLADPPDLDARAEWLTAIGILRFRVDQFLAAAPAVPGDENESAQIT